MAASNGKNGINRGVIAAAVIVVVTVAVIVVTLASRSSSRDDDGEEQASSEDGQAEEERRLDEVRRRVTVRNKRNKRPTGKTGLSYVYPNRPAEAAMKQGYFNPPRPLRFVVTYGSRSGGRTEEEARQRANEARRRFIEGEDSYALIRELSDAPRGIPRELIKRYKNLQPDQASPVHPIKNGFAVFFGTPTSPPNRDGDSSQEAEE
jgi:hypothetical protein